VNEKLKAFEIGTINQPTSLKDLLKRPGVTLEKIARLENAVSAFPKEVSAQAAINIKYEGYIKRQKEQVERAKQLEKTKIPDNFDYHAVSGLSNEVREKFSKIRPLSLGQALRISGITPAAVSIIQVYLKRMTG
jgi:tRNA uridine 5-carboxymethylaminomethyl modification enzyme